MNPSDTAPLPTLESPGSHSPGPWAVYDDGREEGAKDIIFARNGDDTYDIAIISTELPVEVRKANARAIVLTPDLIAALRGFAVGLSSDPDDYPDAAAYRQVQARVNAANELLARL